MVLINQSGLAICILFWYCILSLPFTIPWTWINNLKWPSLIFSSVGASVTFEWMTLSLRSSILVFSFHFHSSILTFSFGYAYCMKILLLNSLTFCSILIDFSLLSIGTLWSHNIPDAFFHFIPLLLFYKARPLISQSFWTFDPRYWKWLYFGISLSWSFTISPFL